MTRKYFVLLACLGLLAAATGASAQPTSGGVGYIPPSSQCPLARVSVTADDASVVGGTPRIAGKVTLLNGRTIPVGVSHIRVRATSTEGLAFDTLATCSGSRRVDVPFNPVPYTYGSVTCSYSIDLDRRVYGSYAAKVASAGGRRMLLQTGAPQLQLQASPSKDAPKDAAKGSSGGSILPTYIPTPSGGGGGCSGLGCFPARGTWSVTASARTDSPYSGECFSSVVTVNTDAWWEWLLRIIFG